MGDGMADTQYLTCSVCGGTQFRAGPVIWPELAAEWQLSDPERAYVDRQQGCGCMACGANLRIIALTNAVRAFVGTPRTLMQAIMQGELRHLRVLDCNGADGLSAALAALPGYFRADYPQYDMRQLPFPDNSFDLIVHSDTLEHIEHPVVALQECRRVLDPAGRLCFSVPIIHGRLTRNRAGLPPSYHGSPSANRGDFIVHSEFGADFYSYVYQAGFTDLALTQVDFPSALAISAWVAPPPL
jgi:SAM-dependent methyltransferase